MIGCLPRLCHVCVVVEGAPLVVLAEVCLSMCKAGPDAGVQAKVKVLPLLSTGLWLMFAGDLQVQGPAAGAHAPAPLAAFAERYAVAEMYQAYALIHKAAHEPFHSIFGATLFNAARFLLMRLLQVSPGAVGPICSAARCAILHTT